MLVYVFNIGLLEFSAANLEKGLIKCNYQISPIISNQHPKRYQEQLPRGPNEAEHLRRNNTTLLTPKRQDKHPRPFYMGAPSRWHINPTKGNIINVIIKFPYNARFDWLKQRTLSEILKLINYSCTDDPIRLLQFGQVHGS